jgi:hypothetical protein
MDIFIYDLPEYCTATKVQREIAVVLHSPEYLKYRTTNGLLNFRIHLFEPRFDERRYENIRTARMTLPTEEVGTRFLCDYGG